MKCYYELATALPKCKITEPTDGIQYILDSDNEKIGEISWNGLDPIIGIYKEYEYAKEVRESIGNEHFYDVKKESHFTEEHHKHDMIESKNEMEEILKKQESITESLYAPDVRQ